VNFLRHLASQGGGGRDDSSRLDVVEIARVPVMLPSLFPSWSVANSYGRGGYVFVAVRCDFHERNSIFKWELTVFNRI